MCYPKSLLTAKDWEVTPMASHVSCTGDHSSTQCKMSCWTSHVPVESSPYLCQKSPCPAWTIGQSGCYRCDYNCTQLHDLMEPQPLSMVEALGCSCSEVVVSARPLKAFPGAALWQSSSMGLYYFIGEHHRRPVYWNRVTHKYLYYYSQAEWLIGTSHFDLIAGIQV